MSTINALALASIIIYIIFLQPTLYIFYRHGWPGFLGWFYLQIFILVRIVGNGLSLHTPLTPSPLIGGPAADASDKHALIVNNIGLSPLLLAAAGLLHEARRARRPGGDSSQLEWGIICQYHMLVSGALVLIVVGLVMLEGGKADKLDTAKAVMKAGAAVVVVCWALLVGGTGISAVGGRGKAEGAVDWRRGTLLLYAVFASLPLIGMRLAYGISVLLLDVEGKAMNKFALSFAAKVVMSTVPEMVLALVFIVVGIMTRDIAGAYWSKADEKRGNGPEMVAARG